MASRSLASRMAAVRRLVEVARTVADRRSTLVPALVESTGLSPEGVELALSRHLELDPTDEDLRRLVAHASDVSRVVVILSSNVFVGALRALALARAASVDVVVRPSRREPAFARALVDAAADPTLRIDDALDVADVEEGEVHVYGRDETIAAVRQRARSTVRVLGHGSGMGVAWLSRAADVVLARDLADDVVAFDQRGCLSPRVALVEGDFDRARAVAEALHAELDRLGVVVPRGALSSEERAESERYVATMAYAGVALVGRGHAIGVAPPGAPIVLAPTHRHVHVVACPRLEDAGVALAPLMRAVVAMGSDDVAQARRIGPTWARFSALGRMQRPPLDGPVDFRASET